MVRKTLFVPIFILLLAMLHAARTGIASLLVMQAREVLDSWALSRVRPDSDEARKNLKLLEMAISLDPENPAYLENVARLQVAEAEINQARKDVYLKEALPAIRKAIELRPVSPYSWGILLVAKSGLDEVDPEFYRALSNATFLGPWEQEVQVEVARAGIEKWGKMDYQQKEAVRKDISRAMKWRSEDIRGIVLSRQCGNCP